MRDLWIRVRGWWARWALARCPMCRALVDRPGDCCSAECGAVWANTF